MSSRNFNLYVLYYYNTAFYDWQSLSIQVDSKLNKINFEMFELQKKLITN